ncbi:DEAD/DEAH box helicase family protein [Rhizobium sp. CFBP 13726]|uniref:DEAD/DEAH box helicase family protein n=1 Tax=Rhizobium sp. CFBP 13726 TaxID=2775296 RepID=UPI00178643D2|nr:DEAD/DEAH box helicase family protein [Rhizobium sp. CFBP 13726]MBD8651071.1 DEAD/DEAH box helicase family protein [Rhizobium sp. CFBP 13726]
MPARVSKFAGWDAVAKSLGAMHERQLVPSSYLDQGQIYGVKALATSLKDHGAVLADEVGMGKTRIAVALALAVNQCGGRVAIVIPPIVEPQWRKEFADTGTRVGKMLRSFDNLMGEYQANGPSRMEEPTVLLSNRFGDVRAARGKRWRANLLKNVIRDFDPHLKLGRKSIGWLHPGIHAASASIFDRAKTCRHTKTAVEKIINEFRDIRNRAELDDADSDRFDNHSEELKLLERSLGLALGAFDLVIIDEAHKARSEWSKLTALLESVLLRRGKSFRMLGLTATPVELDVWQWENTLRRVGMDGKEWAKIKPSIYEFRDAAEAVRQRWRSDETARDRYIKSSDAFQNALAPWVVRRDKRLDDTIKSFNALIKDGTSYRKERPITVDADELSENWRQVVFAAEALSVIGQSAAGTTEARARLTISNGHGVAGIVDKLTKQITVRETADEEKADLQQLEEDLVNDDLQSFDEQYGSSKRKQRAEFWKGVLKAPFIDGDASLYDHPVLSAAIREIEAHTKAGEKVLVFGRFTRPMRILTELLNARALLRAVCEGAPWPHGSTSDSEQVSLRVAAGQLGMDYDRQAIDGYLGRKYNDFEKHRQALRDHLDALIDEAFVGKGSKSAALLSEIGSSERRSESVVLLARAIEPLLPTDTPLERDAVLATLIDVVDKLWGESGNEKWSTLHDLLEQEFKAPRASFARMLYGSTAVTTRRLVQLAFNRSRSEPHVLVAQSLVGREGLNLHESCRTVILLHLEWNPAVVEQQIGRVDRKNSHWSRTLEAAKDLDSSALPRIEFRPVIFRGTYDEHHWSILSRRWDEQRSQLHGQVASEADRANLTDEERALLKSLEERSPDFSPFPKGDRISQGDGCSSTHRAD